MIKRLFLFILCCLILTGCAAPAAADAEGYTFTDDLGRTVTIQNSQRTAALLGSFAQIWQLAGGQVCATADDAWEDLQLDLPENTVNIGNTKDASLELLFSAAPDLILASSQTRQHRDWQETLEATGIPVAYFNVSDFEDYLRLLKLCTDLTSREDLYRKNGLAVKEQIEAVLEQSQKRGTTPTVLSMRASASLITVKNSKDNVLGEMLKALGCVNIADSEDSLLENISIEIILEADPDYIFIVQRGDDAQGMKANVEAMMQENPLWLQLTAVKEGRVYYMDKNLYNLKPNHRWGEAYEKLEAILENG